MIHPDLQCCFYHSDADKDRDQTDQYFQKQIFRTRQEIAKRQSDESLSDGPGDWKRTAFEQIGNDAACHTDNGCGRAQTFKQDSEYDVSEIQLDPADQRNDHDSRQDHIQGDPNAK